MKKLLVFLTVLFSFLNTFATDYYVSNSGSDGANGALATPWATTSKVNSMMGSLVSGDRVFFERGGTFFGTLVISKSNITIGAYGTGNLPVITGFKTLSGWTTSGTNLWTSTSSNSPKSYMRVVTINGVMTRMGRYPDWADNAGSWLTYTNSLPSSSPVTVNFSGTMPSNFVGGELVLRKESYIMDVMPILSQATNSFSCTNPAGLYGINSGLGGYGFFVQNHPATLTSTNEWYFDPSFKTLTIYGAASPTTTIRGAVFDTLVNVTATGVTIENLDIQGSNRFGVITNGSASNFTLRNSIVRFIGYWGVQIGGSSTTILNNLVRDIGSNAIWMANSGLVQGNQVRNVYIIDGMGGSGGDQGFGIALEGNSITCRNNIVDSMGYMGIKIGGGSNGSNIIIRENRVSNFCFNKTDGGGIYSYGANGTWTATNRQIKRNIITNSGKINYGIGGGTLSIASWPLYMDGSTGNIINDSNVIAYNNVSQNTVSSTASPYGIYSNYAILMNNPRNITLTNTITFGHPASLSIHDWSPSIAGTPKPTGNTITNNCFYVNNMPQGANWTTSNTSFQYFAQGSRDVASLQTDVQNIGTWNNNFYPDHNPSSFHWGSYTFDGPYPIKLAAWRTYSGKDLNSVATPTGTPIFVINYGTTGGDTTINFPGVSRVDYKGNVYNNSATIPAYYANIFFNVGSVPPPSGRYYVSNSGNDGNDGLTPATAWATIAKVNSSMGSFNAGDSILFERGGTFTGTLNVTKAGVTFSAYGSGNKPVLTGFYTIPTWSNVGTNLWATIIPSGLNNVRLLTLNDRVIRPGRFPDYVDNFAGWLRYSNQLGATSPVTVTSTTAIPTNLADGELVLFKNNWNLDVMPITSIVGNSITCTNPAGMYGIAANPYIGNWGYFVQNSVNALNQQNEWAYNNTSKVVTMFSTTNPSTLGTIKIPRQTSVVILGSTSNVTLDNLDIQGCTEKAVVSTGGSNQVIKNCNVRFAQGWGIDMRGSSAVIQNNWVRDIGSNGLWVTSSANITGNTFETCGNIEGLAGLTNSGAGTQGNQDNQHTAIEIETGNTSVVNCSNNIIDSSGYAGVRFYGSNITIEKNLITYPCISKSDGAGIYSWDQDGGVTFTNRRVKNNVILNSGKLLFGTSTPGLNTQGYGIYGDAGTSNVLIDSNVIGPALHSPNAGIQNCTAGSITNTEDDGGIYLNGARNVTLRGNIVFGWPQSIAFWRYGQVPALANVTGMRIVGNALYTNPVGSDLCTYNTSFRYYTYDASTVPQMIAQIQGFGVMDSNFIANSPSPFMYKGNAANPGGPVTLATWRTNTGKDLNSVNFPTTTPDFQFNPTGLPITYSFSGLSKRDFRGVVYNNSAVIPPYYGNIFFPNGSSTVTNPPVVVISSTPITCAGGTSTVTVTATGGTPPYTGTGAFTRTAGTWTFSVSDAAGQTTSGTITITQPSALIANSPTAPAITTSGGTTTVTQPPATGGTAPYQYQLGAGAFQSSNVFTNVSAGTYTITIRDACSTTTIKSITIAPFVAPLYKAQIISVNYGSNIWAQNETRNVQVTIQNTGSATWTDGTNGTRDINVGIKWNTSGSFWSDYHSRVNAHPCAPGETRTYSIPIKATLATAPSQSNPVAGPVYTTTPLALGNNNLRIDVVNELGCWFGNNSGGCGPGNTVYVSPAINIVASTSPLVLSSSFTPIGCNSNTSTVTIGASGGVGPYVGTGTFTRPAGTHTFVVTDANNSIDSVTVTISQPTAIVLTTTANNLTCVGGSTVVDISASGGVGPYTGTGSTLRTAGTYTYTVTDSTGCTKTVTVTINNPIIVPNQIQ